MADGARKRVMLAIALMAIGLAGFARWASGAGSNVATFGTFASGIAVGASIGLLISAWRNR